MLQATEQTKSELKKELSCVEQYEIFLCKILFPYISHSLSLLLHINLDLLLFSTFSSFRWKCFAK